MGDISNKQRILNLMEIFKSETDENHHLSVDDIYERMIEKAGPNFNANMKSIRSDIESLSDFGFNIDHEVGSHNKKLYYFQDRDFEFYELRMLIDAVSSAKFITSDESQRLIEKLKSQTSSHLSKNLENQIFLEKKVKCENNSVRYYIDTIHRAIGNNFKLKYKYGSYDVNKNFNLHKDGNYYILKPYALVWNNDFYYIIGIYEGKEKFSHYRIDRMRKVEILEENFEKVEFDVSDYLNKTFNMYSGEVDIVYLKFHKKLINVVLDRFGTDVDIYSIDKDTFSIKVQAAVSEGLVRWLLTWGSDVEVISPDSLKASVMDEIAKMCSKYNIK